MLKSLAVNPGGIKWATLDQLFDHFGKNADKYVVQFVVFAAIFGVTSAIMGIKLQRFLAGFAFL
jgi:hypothetical protein